MSKAWAPKQQKDKVAGKRMVGSGVHRSQMIEILESQDKKNWNSQVFK